MASIYNLTATVIRKLYDTRISGPAVLDNDDYFPGAILFEEHWQTIREEALVVATELGKVPRFHELLPSQADISANDQNDWRMFVLKAYGVSFKNNLEQCPCLQQLLNDSPDVLSATLSFLAPHKHIPRHRGPFRGVVRYYLGLSVPLDENGKPSTLLSLDDRHYYINNGESLLWDDTYPHEVWNNSKQIRIALLLDVRRRHMPADMKLLSHFIVSAAGALARLKSPG